MCVSAIAAIIQKSARGKLANISARFASISSDPGAPAVRPRLRVGDQAACEIPFHGLSRKLIGSLTLFKGSGPNMPKQFFRDGCWTRLPYLIQVLRYSDGAQSEIISANALRFASVLSCSNSAAEPVTATGRIGISDLWMLTVAHDQLS